MTDVRAVYRRDPASGVGAINHEHKGLTRFQQFEVYDDSTVADPLAWIAADTEAVIELREAV